MEYVNMRELGTALNIVYINYQLLMNNLMRMY
jgi:hypothetical protein